MRSKIKSQHRTFYNDKGVNPTGRYNTYKYLCTKIRTPKYMKQILTDVRDKLTVIW